MAHGPPSPINVEREPQRVRGVRHERNRGIVGGWKSGLEAASGELICLIDSDLQNRPEDIVRLYEALAGGGS